MVRSRWLFSIWVMSSLRKSILMGRRERPLFFGASAAASARSRFVAYNRDAGPVRNACLLEGMESNT